MSPWFPFRVAQVISLAFMLPAGLAFSQEQEPILAESIEVRIMNVDVIVTDREGNRVQGLTSADFELLQDGDSQPITNFSEYRGRAATLAAMAVEPDPEKAAQLESQLVPASPRKIILCMDRFALSRQHRDAWFDSIKAFVRESMRPGDEVMIATYDHSMKVPLHFTSDLKAVEKEIDRIASVRGAEWRGRDELRDLEQAEKFFRMNPEATEADVQAHMDTSRRQEAQVARAKMRNRVAAVNSLIASVGGLEGRKIMLLASESFSRLAGMEYFIPRGGTTDGPPTGAMEFNTSSIIERLIRTANSHGVTIYPLHPTGIFKPEASAEFESGTASSRNYMILDNELSALSTIANETGGLLAAGPLDVQRVLPQIVEDLESYYSLGYRVEASNGRDRTRSINVRTKRPGLKVRVRKSVEEKSWDAQMEDYSLANLFNLSERNNLGISVEKERVNELTRGKKAIPLKIRIPISRLTALPQGDQHLGRFSVFIVAADQSGDYSDVIRKSQPFSIPAAQLAKAQSSHFTYEISVNIRGTGDRISVGVMDEISRETGFARVEIKAAPAPIAPPAFSQPTGRRRGFP